MNENTDFGVPQLSNQKMGLSCSTECKLEWFVDISLGVNFVFDFAFEADQGRHGVCALDINHESEPSLHTRIVFGKYKYELSFADLRDRHVLFSLA